MDKILAPIKCRIIQYIESKGITKKSFFENTKISPSNFKGNGLFSEIGGDLMVEILTFYPDINPTWLLTGKGEMLVGGKKYDEMPDTPQYIVADGYAKPANSDLVAYLERKLDEKTRECYDLQAKIEGLACELRRRKEAPAEEHPLADVG